MLSKQVRAGKLWDEFSHVRKAELPDQIVYSHTFVSGSSDGDFYENNHLFKVPVGGKLYVKLSATGSQQGILKTVLFTFTMRVCSARRHPYERFTEERVAEA